VLAEGYKLIPATPTSDDYRRLRIAAGLSPKSAEAAAIGLPNTLFAVIIQHHDEVIGMGRIVGDGGLFLQIVDIAVDPAHQKLGLGKAIVSTLVDHVKTIALDGTYVSLIADGPAEHLYAQFGFTQTAPASVGMYLPLT